MLLFCRVSPNTFSRHPIKLCFTGRLLPYSRSIIAWTSLPKSKTLWRDYHQCENNLTFNCSRVSILISPTQSYPSCLLRVPFGDEQNWLHQISISFASGFHIWSLPMFWFLILQSSFQVACFKCLPFAYKTLSPQKEQHQVLCYYFVNKSSYSLFAVFDPLDFLFTYIISVYLSLECAGHLVNCLKAVPMTLTLKLIQ